jgi:hypothetical protein
MSTEYIERSTTIINQIEGLELVPHAMRLLADGEPVAIERLAAAARRPIAEVEAALQRLHARDRHDHSHRRLRRPP